MSAVPPPVSLSEDVPDHLIPKEEWYEAYLRYGLYLGAAFQLVCILAVLVLPTKKAKGEHGWDEVTTTDTHCP